MRVGLLCAYLVVSLALFLSRSGLAEGRIMNASAESLFREAKTVAVVNVKNAFKSETARSPCQKTGEKYTIIVGVEDIVLGKTPPSLLCSDEAYALDERLLAVVGNNAYQRWLRKAWIIEKDGSDEYIRPRAGDPLLSYIGLHAQQAEICRGNRCVDLVLYQYLDLAILKKKIAAKR